MLRYIVRLDRIPLLMTAAALVIFLLLAGSELVQRDIDGLTASLAPYFPILVAVAWAAPVPARELENGTALWSWSMGVTRRRWLRIRMTALLSAAVVGGAALGGIVALTQRSWTAGMTTDRITAVQLDASWPAVVAFSLFAVGLGLAAAVMTRRTVAAIGIALAGQVAITYLAPAITVALAPRAQQVGTSTQVAGHVVAQDVVHGLPTVFYVANSSFWPLAWTMSGAIVALGSILTLVALNRISAVPG